MQVVIIDNYDSFTYNLAHATEPLCRRLEVIRNDKVDVESLWNFDRMIFSPGPGLPSEVRIMQKILQTFCRHKPILGVCLGMQAIGEFFGARLFNLTKVEHGIPQSTLVTDPEELLFKGIPPDFQSGRYHSWALNRESLPDCFKITATDPNGVIMAIRHRELDVCGVQFHPESIMTPPGNRILQNWIEG